MTTANIYTLAEAQAALKGKRFHWHETITDFVESFKIRSIGLTEKDGVFRLIGKNAQHIISGSTLVKLLRYGQCSSNFNHYLITAK